MHVGGRDADIAHLQGAEAADVAAVLANQKAPELGQVGAQCEAVDGFEAALLLQLGERLTRQLLEILMPGGDADVVKTVVAADWVGAVQRMAAHAARLAVVEDPSLLRLLGDGVVLPREKLVE